MEDKPSILVVDDSHEDLKVIVGLLIESDTNYLVMKVGNVDGAMKIAQQRLPSLIITDWNMPDKSGIDLIRVLKTTKETKDIPVIVTTGFMLAPQDIRTALEAGALDYISKPIKKVELEARVNSALMLKRSYDETLQIKNSEINDSMLHLVKTNEFLKQIPEKLQKLDGLNDNDQKKVNAIVGEIDAYFRSEIWERFETSFNTTHSGFYKNILAKYPSLTPTDLKLSALIFLGMNTKDISSLLSQSSDSIKVARYRLRKRMGLNDKENLQAYLAKI